MRVIYDDSLIDNMDNVIIYVSPDEYNNKNNYAKLWKECPLPFVIFKQEEEQFYNNKFVWKIRGDYVCKASDLSLDMFKQITNYYASFL